MRSLLSVDPENPVPRAFREKKAWLYFHTHTVTRDTVEASAKQSIEFDVYAPGPGAECTIQHPNVFYSSRGQPLPANLALEAAVQAFEATGPEQSVLVLDCKSRHALPKIQELVARLGAHRTVVHGFVKELAFLPLPAGVETQPHWVDEDQSIADLVAAASPPGVEHRAAVMVTCRHVTLERLESSEWGVPERIEAVAGGHGVDCVGLWLPGGVAPPREVAARLLRAGLLLSYNVDTDEPGSEPPLPGPFVGMTDTLFRASFAPLPR